MLYSKNKKRGFTLVELIVVLVILAILAALLIPALTGYIDKAKKDQVIAETCMLHEAVQTEMVEIYGSFAQWKNTSNRGDTTIASSSGAPVLTDSLIVDSATLQKRYNEIVSLSEVPSLQPNTTQSTPGKFFVLINGSAKVHAIVYNSGRGYLGVYFSDTQQYSAYTLGDTTDNRTITDDSYSNYYYGSVLHITAIDDNINDSNDPNTAYIWSCVGIRANLGIEEPSYN